MNGLLGVPCDVGAAVDAEGQGPVARELVLELLRALLADLTVSFLLGVAVEVPNRAFLLGDRQEASDRLLLCEFFVARLSLGQSSAVLLRLVGDSSVRELHRREDGLHAVVVLRRDRVKFMVMAFGTAQLVGEEGDADGVDDVIEVLLAGHDRDAHRGVLPGSHAQEAGGDEMVGVAGLELIAGQLFTDELVVGFVGVEAADHVVAVAPGVWSRIVVGETRRVGVAHHVEPVAGHLFAVVGAPEEPLNERLPGLAWIFFPVGEEIIDLLRARRQAGQVVGRAPDEGCGVRSRGRSQAARQPSVDEGIDRVGTSPGHLRSLKRLVGPEASRVVLAVGPPGVEPAAGLHRDAALGRPRILLLEHLLDPLRARPRRAARYPVADVFHLCFAELVVLLGGHGGPVVFVFSRDGEVEGAFERFAGNDRRFLALTACEQAGPGAQVEIPLELSGLLAMAGKASLLEERQHLAREDHLGGCFRVGWPGSVKRCECNRSAKRGRKVAEWP